MSRAAVHFILLSVAFACTWFLLSRMDFLSIFHVRQLTQDNERKLGNLILRAVRAGDDEITSDSLKQYLDGLKADLCRAGDLPDSIVTVHLLVKDEVNAFALPGNHLVLYTGLVEFCNGPQELSGVMAHEIGHIRDGHVMKRLIEQVGLSMLLTVLSGDAGSDIVRQIVKLISSGAFDREQESEADAAAVHIMARAGIDPEHLANLLFRLSQQHGDVKHLEWLSSHPFTQDRVSQILQLRSHEKTFPSPEVDTLAWINIRRIIRESR